MLITQHIDRELKGDRQIWFLFILLCLMSLLAVYSSTGTKAFLEKDGNTILYLMKHGVVLALGIACAYISHLVHYMKYAKFAPLFLILAIPLLLYTKFFGLEINHARRWLEFPLLGLTFQTSDFAKLVLIIYLARTISMKQEQIKDFKKGFVPLLLPVVIICGLIAPENLSTAAILFFTSFVMMFVGRVSIKHLFGLVMSGVLMLGLILMLGRLMPSFARVQTWENRILNFVGIAPEGAEKPDTYQVDMAKVAIANGGWLGVGPGNSFQRNYLPYPYADFIYAIIFEEYGLVGGLFVIGCYLWLFFRCVKLVTRSPRAFGAILAMGLSLLLMVQAFITMAVSVNLLPVTGVNLPLISMGGTSILFIGVTLGIILSVSKYIESPAQDDQSVANEQAD
jgi:cell division protein FtsW